ncbi:MAG: HAMP domain-containing histidine kinase [Bdellovibrionaceae bacterium]|nr:HAMP domain-containing histidine kinase [Pseudobdellovibrionaceae bacterium]MBX3034289.1 HAMP domain-containing histidine kinase [Pseudobdellovibrionaceae bacterium]
MNPMTFLQTDPASILTATLEKLSMATSLPEITRCIARAARALTGADGTTFVLRDGENCYYADEDAISALWKGRRFPLRGCISGWAMLHRQVVQIRDIYQDPRIPHDAYRPTFVKSLCMVPVRFEQPIAAIGSYWAQEHSPSHEDLRLLQTLANSCAVALENLDLRNKVERSDSGDIETPLHTLAHDLKNPLTNISLFAELIQLRSQAELGEDTRRYLNSIVKTCGNMAQQINRMLSLYQASGGDLRREPVNLTHLAREIMDHLRAQSAARQIDFVVDDDLTVQADPALMRLVLENLLGNAVKYTSKKPAAKIRLGHAPQDKLADKPGFFIEDNGAGFDPEQSHRLFQPLVRLHRSGDFPGTGLGLASVARVIQRHGGQIHAEGRPGDGAVFYFSLPGGH